MTDLADLERAARELGYRVLEVSGGYVEIIEEAGFPKYAQSIGTAYIIMRINTGRLDMPAGDMLRQYLRVSPRKPVDKPNT